MILLVLDDIPLTDGCEFPLRLIVGLQHPAVHADLEQAVGSRHSVFPAQQIGTRLLALVDIRHQQFQLIRTCRYVETIALQLLTHRLVERTIVGLLDFRLCLDGLAPDIAVRATHRDRYRP